MNMLFRAGVVSLLLEAVAVAALAKGDARAQRVVANAKPALNARDAKGWPPAIANAAGDAGSRPRG